MTILDDKYNKEFRVCRQFNRSKYRMALKWKGFLKADLWM